ncbi:MAG: galactose mutarotase [Candidatus Obscuribacterales bacterium]|nr:galactose mutarotase [Candidatus Obscuribacterales bacterium]
MNTKVKPLPFGILANGEEAHLYTLTNKSGAIAKITDYGATLTELHVPNAKGEFANIVLGYPDLQGYLGSKVYMGATVGRYANRIANGRFTLNGQEYKLAVNNGTATLHGGLKGFDKAIWQTEQISGEKWTGLKMTHKSPHMDEGFPGELDVVVTYKLTDSNQLQIIFEATCDRPTILNLTNHSYFNLDGAGVGNILNHRLQIDADAITAIGSDYIPTGELASVKDTAFDFRTAKPIGRDFAKTGSGYDHNFCVNKPVDAQSREEAKLDKAQLELTSPVSGRRLRIYTTHPGLQVFTANSFDALKMTGSGGAQGDQCGVAIEPQHYPDSINHPSFPSVVLNSGEKYWHREVLDFTP